MSAKTLIKARRTVERMRLEAGGAGQSELAIWDAEQKVTDAEAAERGRAIRTARTAGRAMDAVLLVVAVLTMGFSLGNIHQFAAAHAVGDPIAWFLAPAVDLALIAALLGDAVLSRWQLDAGPWATRLRWYTGGATLVLNTWEAWASLDPAAIVLHTVPPVLLFVLAEAASPYRHQFAETVKKAAAGVDTAPAAKADTETPAVVDTPAPTEADTVPALAPATPAGEVYDQEREPAVSTMTPQDAAPDPAVDWDTYKRAVSAHDGFPTAAQYAATEADTAGKRLDADAAKAAIEKAWDDGLTVREAAVKATRSASYVGGVYARLTKQRGTQPSKGQMQMGDAA